MESVSRNSNIEMLRIISASAVMILHLNGASNALLITFNKINLGLMVLLESFAIPAVNIFILISGLLMINKFKVTVWKPLLLLIQVSFVKVLFYLVQCFIWKTKILSITSLLYAVIPNNYFVIFYVVLYLLSIYINKLLNMLTSEENRQMVVISMILLSVYPFAIDVLNTFLFQAKGTSIGNLSTISRSSSLEGYTIIHFLLIYFLGGYIGTIKDKIRKLGVKIPLIIYLVCTLLIFISTYFVLDREKIFQPGITLAYNNPIIILQSLAAVVIFYNKKPFQSVVINKMGFASFMCYIVHLEIITWAYTIVSIDWTDQFGFLKFYGSFIVIVYMLSIFLNLIYSKIERIIFSELKLKYPFELSVQYDRKEKKFE